MTTTLYNVSQVLGAGILHSLWQGMAVYIALRIVFAAVPMSSQRKYYIAVVALLTVSALFVYTLFSAARNFNWSVLKPLHATAVSMAFGLPAKSFISLDVFRGLSPYMPYICAVYLAGLLGNFAKLGWEWNKVRLIKRSAIYAEQMQQFIVRFSKKLDIGKHVGIKFSELIDVPCVIGIIKPLILLPVSLSTQLTACEVESILLHELAHIRRNDYLLNLLQQVVSVMLFFNPFSRSINRIINQERENSCDDLVVAKTGKPLIYAQALLKLETTRAGNLQLALAATGKKFYLLNRIERIMKKQQKTRNMRHLFIAVLLLAGGLCGIAWMSPIYAKIKNAKSTHTALAAVSDTTGYRDPADTGKHKNKTTKTYVKKHVVVKKAPDTVVYNAPDDSAFAYFQSPEWKEQQEAWKKMGEQFKKQFDSPEWKAQQEEWKKQAMAMAKQFDSPEWKEQWKKQADELKKQFDSPEWKEQWKKQADELKKQFDSPEWKEQWKKQADELKKQFDNPEWKEQWKKQADELKKQFDSPEWKEQWKKQAEELKKQFNSEEWKQQMKKMSEDMKKQFDSKEWKDAFKNQKWMWKDSVGGIHIYKAAPADSVKN